MKIIFVLPTKNEATSIAGVVRGLQKLCVERGLQQETLVVDDSQDATAELASAMGATVISGGGLGLGYAMLLGLREALRRKADWICSLDADGQADLEEIPFFLSHAEETGAEVLLSSRFLGKKIEYTYPWINWIGNRILVGILRLATGFPFTDSHGGIRLMRPHVLHGLVLIGHHTYVQETLIQMVRNGAKIVELPSRWRIREMGRSRVLHSIPHYVWRTSPALLYWLCKRWLSWFPGVS